MRETGEQANRKSSKLLGVLIALEVRAGKVRILRFLARLKNRRAEHRPVVLVLPVRQKRTNQYRTDKSHY
jgi:hypothetical protein